MVFGEFGPKEFGGFFQVILALKYVAVYFLLCPPRNTPSAEIECSSGEYGFHTWNCLIRRVAFFAGKGMCMEDNCIFCKIVKGEIPSTRVFENDEFLAFKDRNPAAPVHVLVIPKRHIPRLSAASAEDAPLLGNMLVAVGLTAKELGLENYRLIINDGAGAGQTVFHLHAHILSGKELGERLL